MTSPEAQGLNRRSTDAWTAAQVKEFLAVGLEDLQERLEASISTLAIRVDEGDQRLVDHIASQVTQIRDAMTANLREVSLALESSEKLELQRIGAVQRETVLVQEAADRAISKSEAAMEKRFEGVNEFRAQLADQSGTFLPRETFDSVIGAWNTWRQTTDTRLDRMMGAEVATQRGEDRLQPWVIWLAGAAITLVITAVIIVANVLSTH